MSRYTDSYLNRWDAPPTPQTAAMPPTVRLMLSYGLWGGLIVGVIGQFVFRIVLEQLLLNNQSLDEVMVLGLIVAQQVFLIMGLGLIMRRLAGRITAPNTQVRVLIGLSIGFLFALMGHTLLVGSMSGALANRDTFIFLYEDFSTNAAVFNNILLTGVERTLLEGTVIGVLTLVLQSFAGGVFAGLLVDVEALDVEPPQPDDPPLLRDAFGSLAIALLPILFFGLFISNGSIYAEQEAQLVEFAAEQGVTLETSDFFTLPTLLPLIAIPVIQALALLWLQNCRVRSLHGRVLRLAQAIHVLTMGLLIIPLTFLLMPDIPQQFVVWVLVALTVILAWGFGLVAQMKLRELAEAKLKPNVVLLWNLLVVIFGVTTLGFLLLDFFGLRSAFNIASFPGALAASGLRVTLNPEAELSFLLSNAMHTTSILFGLLWLGALVVAELIFGAAMWFINRSEARLAEVTSTVE